MFERKDQTMNTPRFGVGATFPTVVAVEFSREHEVIFTEEDLREEGFRLSSKEYRQYKQLCRTELQLKPYKGKKPWTGKRRK